MRLPSEEVGAGEGRDERVGGRRDEVGRGAGLPQLSVDQHADAPRKSSRVLEVVRDEQRRDLELGEELLQLGPHLDLRVRVESRERLVEQQDLGIPRERAGERDALPFTAGEAARTGVLQVPDPEAVEVLVRRVPACVLDVLADGEVRKERVVLEDETDPTVLRWHEDASAGVEPGLLFAADRAGGRLEETGDGVEDGALAGA